MGIRGGGRRRSWGWGEPPWSAPHCLPRCSLEQRRANYRERLWAAGRPRLATFTALLHSKLTRLFQKCLEGLKRSLGGLRAQWAQMRPGQEFSGGLLAHCRDLVGRGKNQGTEGGRLGSEWQEELRQRAGRTARLCEQGRGLSPPLLESWTYECAALLTTINSPGGRARARAEGGAGPS